MAAVAAEALARPGHERRADEPTGGESLTCAEAAAVSTDVLGRPIRYVAPSPWRSWRRMRARGHPAAFVQVTRGIYAVTRVGFAGRVTPEVERLLGRPSIAFERFVRDSADAWR